MEGFGVRVVDVHVEKQTFMQDWSLCPITDLQLTCFNCDLYLTLAKCV